MARGKGEGTIVRRESGSLMAQISLGFTVGTDGKRNRIRKTVYGSSKSEILKKMDLLRKEAGLGLSDEKLSVSEYLDRWLIDTVKSSTKPKTFTSYSQTVRNYLKPYLASVPLKAFTAAHAKAMVTDQTKDAKPLPSIRYAFRVLKIALNDAEEDRLISFNPIVNNKAPKAIKKKFTPWTSEEATKFLRYLDVAAETNSTVARLRAFFYVAVYAGLRHGELLALKWSDIDAKKFIVKVDQSLNHYNRSEGGTKLEETKSSQVRDVDVSPIVVAALKAHRALRATEELKGTAVNANPATSELVFKTKTGNSYSKSNIRRLFIKLCNRAGVPVVRIHDLRHTHATLWLENGASLKEVQERLGHADPTITLVHYGHVSPQRKKESAGRLDKVLGG